MFWILVFAFVLAPAFAAWENRQSERKAARLVEAALSERAAGQAPRQAKPERPKVLWPYALVAILIAAWWTFLAHRADASAPVGLAIGLSLVVWLPFHIFIFVKRTKTLGSLVILAAMIAAGIGVSMAAQSNPAIDHTLRGLS